MLKIPLKESCTEVNANELEQRLKAFVATVNTCFFLFALYTPTHPHPSFFLPFLLSQITPYTLSSSYLLSTVHNPPHSPKHTTSNVTPM